MSQIRAAIYCRCSTEEESQIDALGRQVLEGKACVEDMGWILSGEYVESKSGTTRKGRAEYNRLFEDLQSDLFDVIVIKSQDRLMRNVKDWYLFLDRMVSNGKRLYMYIEHKYYTPDDALITGIKAILAEEYSRELSKKINNAHRQRQKNGGKVMLTSKVYGFCKNPDGSVSVVEEEAGIIQMIYEYCKAGYGCRTIANILRNRGYQTKTGNAFTAASVGRIIRNPLYKGIMVMNRLHYDFETKKTIKVPEDQWIFGNGLVPAIVNEELWEQANRAMTERAEVFHRNGKYVKGRNAGRYDLSGKIVCGFCKSPYYRTWRKSFSKKEIIVEWKCSNYLENGREDKSRRDKLRKVTKEYHKGCNNVHLEEGILFSLLEKVNIQYYAMEGWNQDAIVERAIKILKRILEKEPVNKERERLDAEEKKINKQKDFLLTKYMEGIISDKDYRKRDDKLEADLLELQTQKEKLRQKEENVRTLEQRIKKMKERIKNGGIERATVNQMLQDVKEIRVYGWRLEICFDPLKIADLPESHMTGGDLTQKLEDENFSVWVDYPFPPETERGRYLDRRRIMELLRKDSRSTAKHMAETMGRSAYMVRNRIEELVKGGYIRFNGKGGRGTWEIIKDLPDKEISIKTGGL